MSDQPDQPDQTLTLKLSALLSGKFRQDVELSSFERLTRGGGANVWRFTCARADGKARPLLARAYGANARQSDFDEEVHNQGLAAGIALAPEVVVANRDAKIFVTLFQAGRQLRGSDLGDKVIAHKLALALRSLHQSDVDFLHDHDFLRRMKRRELRVLEEDTPSGVLELSGRMAPVLDRLERSAGPQVPSHSDAVVHNALLTPQGHVKFVDWERSGMGDPHEEIATLIWSAGLHEPHVQACLNAYFTSEEKIGRARTILHLASVPYDFCLRMAEKAQKATSDSAQAAYLDKVTYRMGQVTRMLERPGFDEAFCALR